VAKKPKKLNVQGLARKEPLLLKCILPDTGNVLVSIDLSAGEPTVTSEFSRDKNYIYATFEGVGKTPFYKDDLKDGAPLSVKNCGTIFSFSINRAPS